MDINWGNAKEPEQQELPEDGTYTLVVDKWEKKEATKPESRAKGFGISVQFHIDDPDFEKVRVYHYQWVHFENPWGAKRFVEAVSGRELDGDVTFDITDGDYFVGEKVNAFIYREPYTSKAGKEREKMSVDPDSFMTAN